MSVRALIVAIEHYPNAKGLAQELDGTLQAGRDFRTWLLEKWKADGHPDAETELLFCSEPAEPYGTGAQKKDLLKALNTLKTNGQNKSSEVYLFFSGHGFSFVDRPGSRTDFLVSADYEDPTLSADCCLSLDGIVAWLQAHLGPGRQYYFVDACRNILNPAQIQPPTTLPLPFDPQGTAEATTFVLQSTAAGSVTAVGGPFPNALMAGLKGAGRAKVKEPARANVMVVKYESLRRHLRNTLLPQPSISSRVTGPDGDGESDAILATISPIPESRCIVRLAGAAAGQNANLAITRDLAGVPTVRAFAAPEMIVPLPADDYWMSVDLPGATISPAGLVSVDLYSDQTIVFNSVVAPPPPAPPPIFRGPAVAGGREEALPVPPASPRDASPPPPAGGVLDIVIPPDRQMRVRNVDKGNEMTFDDSQQVGLPPGRYLATLRGRSGEVIKREELDLAAGQVIPLNLSQWETSVPHRSIATLLPQQGGGVDFSESLGGPITDTDLDLWLALLGAGRILGSQGDYSKLARFPLHDFQGEKAGASPTYVLAGFEAPTRLQVGTSQDEHVRWQDAVEPPGMPGILEAYLPDSVGTGLVSFRIDDDPSYTIATATMPNRATLVTVTRDDEERPKVTQYLLPLGHLVGELPAFVRDGLQGRNHLGDIQFLARASRAFRRRRDLMGAVPSVELMDLLYAKWLDPIANSLAAYEFVRRGRADQLSVVVDNMKKYFPDLPDTWALARITGDPNVQPRGVPLFLDGLRAFPGYDQRLPLPAGLLDFTSPWTAWQGAIRR